MHQTKLAGLPGFYREQRKAAFDSRKLHTAVAIRIDLYPSARRHSATVGNR